MVLTEGCTLPGKPKASNEELMHLRKELENVRLERDILKKAVAIFSRQK